MSSILYRRLGSPFAVARRFYSEGGAPKPSRTPGEATIYSKLESKFTPSQLLVQDVSGGCGDFYAITISSGAFKGLSTLKQHRMVQEELKEVIGSIHGLQLKTIAS